MDDLTREEVEYLEARAYAPELESLRISPTEIPPRLCANPWCGAILKPKETRLCTPCHAKKHEERLRRYRKQAAAYMRAAEWEGVA